MSTYSPSLRIELIGTGDQAGVWGNTTNTNLGTLLESSIAGYVSVSVTSANQAFTALNGAADEARQQTIALTTTTGANFAVYAPPAEKTYVIYNASSYTATIYNSTVIGNTTAAGTGVAIPTGKTVTVWSDGTNFAFQNNHLSSLTLATPLAVAQGGTGVTTSTGSGSTVLSASPTLTSPTLTSPALTGTPTAPTAASGTNTTQIATTAFVQAAAGSVFASGTVLVFGQTSAPTGWTKSTTHNNKALRIVSGAVGSGGTTPFTSVFANQTPTISNTFSISSTTLTTSQIPSHTHSQTIGLSQPSGAFQVSCNTGPTSLATTTGATGGGGSHTHAISGSATSSAITLDVQYVDVIFATKD